MQDGRWIQSERQKSRHVLVKKDVGPMIGHAFGLTDTAITETCQSRRGAANEKKDRLSPA